MVKGASAGGIGIRYSGFMHDVNKNSQVLNDIFLHYLSMLYNNTEWEAGPPEAQQAYWDRRRNNQAANGRVALAISSSGHNRGQMKSTPAPSRKISRKAWTM